MTLRDFTVTAHWKPEMPFVGEAGRADVKAFTHKHAVELAALELDLPDGCVTYTPRMVDRSEYEVAFQDSCTGRLLMRAPRLVVNNAGRR